MSERFPLPARLAGHVRRFAESGESPATPRTAATVMLLRPAPTGFEVYLQRRAATMAFAPGMYAFPGGSVDPRDAGQLVGWAGPSPAEWSARLGMSEAGARALVCAAVREVFEECGVLLAGPDESTVVGDVAPPEWEAARVALLARERSLAQLLADRALAVRTDLLVPWDRWLTPEFEPRRYDTYFFLARLPAAQLTRDVGGEAEHTVWLPPLEAAQLPMFPPTVYQLRRLAQYSDVDSAMSANAGRDLTSPVLPRVESDHEGIWLVATV